MHFIAGQALAGLCYVGWQGVGGVVEVVRMVACDFDAHEIVDCKEKVLISVVQDKK